MNFREAIRPDIPQIQIVRHSVTENVLSNPGLVTDKDCADYLFRRGRGWVCEREGVILGFSYAAKEDSSIWALFVAPEYEGLGVGQGLLKLATDYLFELGNTRIILGTSANTRADRFYAEQGWIRGDMRDAIEVNYTLYKPGYQADSPA